MAMKLGRPPLSPVLQGPIASPLGLTGMIRRATPAIGISALTAPFDNSAQGTVIATLTVPTGYTLEMNDDCNGCFQLDGNDLEVGPQAASLRAGWYLVVVGAYIDGDIPTATSWTELSRYIIVTVEPAVSPADITGLTHAWRLDDASVTLSGSGITSVAGAWGTSNAATGAFGSGGGTIPQIATGLGPNGKNYASFPSGRPRFTFATTGALTEATFFAVFRQSTPSGQQATFGNANNNNYVSFATSANAWSSQAAVKGNGGTEHTSNLASNGLFDHRGFQVLVVVWDGAEYIPYVNGIAGAASAHADAITITQFGGTNSSFNFGGGVIAFGIYNKALDATERGTLERALEQFRTRDFFFAADGNDSNDGWSPTTAKLSPATFAAAYKTQRGTRIGLKEGDTFETAGASITFPQNTASLGCRGAVFAYNPTTRLPTGIKATIDSGGAVAAIDTSSGFIQSIDIKTTNTAGNGSIRLRGSSHSINRCESEFAEADAFNLAGSGIVHTDCYIHDIGSGTPAVVGDFAATDYDGHTMHGGAGKFYRMRFKNIERHAFAHQDQSTALEYYGLIIEDSAFAARIIDNAGAGTLLKIRRAYIASRLYGLRWDPGADMDLDIDDALLVNLGTPGSGVALDKNGASVTFTVGANVSQVGFSSLQ